MKLTNFPISLGSPIFFVGNVCSNFFKSLIRSLTLSVLKGPGAKLITDIFLFEYSLLKDFNKLVKAILNEDEIINDSPGSFIIDEDIKKPNHFYLS